MIDFKKKKGKVLEIRNVWRELVLMWLPLFKRHKELLWIS